MSATTGIDPSAVGAIVVGVDACSLAGGGITHLRGVLSAGDPPAHGIRRIRIWAPRRLLDQLPQPPWLEGISASEIEGPRWRRILWQRRALPREVASCDLLWSPGGFVPFRHSPLVTMSQNSLLYDTRERRRYGWSPMRLRLELLRRSQIRSIRAAEGVIFLTDWGEQLVRGAVDLSSATCMAPHGIDPSFLSEPRPQRPIAEYDRDKPFRLVYVSIVDRYKHQWHVARAVAALRQRGIPLEITFAGPAYPPSLRRFRRVLAELDPEEDFLHYVGPVPYARLPELYRSSDLCVFASTCENLPNILLEAMGTGIPIACSHRRPMCDVIADAGILFDAESPDSIASAIHKLVDDADLRARCARRARELAGPYTWERCAEQTLAFLARVAREHVR